MLRALALASLLVACRDPAPSPVALPTSGPRDEPYREFLATVDMVFHTHRYDFAPPSYATRGPRWMRDDELATRIAAVRALAAANETASDRAMLAWLAQYDADAAAWTELRTAPPERPEGTAPVPDQTVFDRFVRASLAVRATLPPRTDGTVWDVAIDTCRAGGDVVARAEKPEKASLRVLALRCIHATLAAEEASPATEYDQHALRKSLLQSGDALLAAFEYSKFTPTSYALDSYQMTHSIERERDRTAKKK